MRNHYNIEIVYAARLEIEDAYDWYEDQKPGLGLLFLKAVDNAFVSIQKSPKGFIRFNHHNQIPLNDFPFVILYEIVGNILYVDAVFHTSRNPEHKNR